MSDEFWSGDQWGPEEYAGHKMEWRRLEINRLPALKTGDVLTFEKVFDTEPNPNRRWWQFWKPRTVQTPYLRNYRIMEMITSDRYPDTLPKDK